MPRKRIWYGLTVLAVVAVALGAVALRKRHERPAFTGTPNVILITIDTQRPDRLSAYGSEVKTPNIDRLANEGVLFGHAFADVTWTTPSMSSVMTGHYSTVHKVRSNFDRLSPQATTLAALLQLHGVHTAAIIASFPLASIYGLNQGFQLYDEDFTHALRKDAPEATPGEPLKKITPAADLFGNSRWPMLWFMMAKANHDGYRPDNEVSDRVIRWLQQERHDPFFLWVHYLGPHEKPEPGPELPWAQRYDRDVAFTDGQIGRVLDALDQLGLTDRTAVILHADHGESLGEHGFFGHGRYIFDATEHIPLLMRLPGRLPAGKRVDAMVRNVDLFATVLELMGVKDSVPVDGTGLLPLIDGDGKGPPQETYVETYLSANTMFADKHGDQRIGFRRFGIRTPDWKFVVNDPIPILDRDDSPPVTPEMHAKYFSEDLYDLHADPGETKNVIDAHPDLAAHFRERVTYYQSLKAEGQGSEKVQLDDASRERLRNLGYLAH